MVPDRHSQWRGEDRLEGKRHDGRDGFNYSSSGVTAIQVHEMIEKQGNVRNWRTAGG